MIKLNKSSYNYKKYFFKKLSPNIIQTHKSNWLVVDPTNKLIEIETKIPYISIFFWLNLILESDLKKKILKKKPINSNTSVYDKNFKPSSIFDIKSIKKKNIIFQEDETPFILSIYIDDQAYDSSRKKSVKAVYLVVENFETGSRLKDKTIFLLMNIPKNVPIYNLTAPLPFVKEIFQLSKMNCLYKHKIKIIFHQIIGDSVEQQKSSRKIKFKWYNNVPIIFPICWAHLLLEGLFKDGLYSIKQRLNSQISTISKKLDSLNTYIKFINLPLNPFNKPKDLTAIECLELSMVLGLCIKNSKENLIIFEWLDLFNSIVSNLYLPSRCENDELELEDFCIRFRIKHIELIDYFKLKPNLDTKDHDINMKQITDIRKKRIKNISMKYYIEKRRRKKPKAVNKKKEKNRNLNAFGELPDDFRNIINFIPDTWSDSLCKENDQERENTSNSTKKMEIEKENDISENQSNNNQATQDLVEIDIESKETKENVLKRQIIEVQNQIDPRVFKINLHLDQKLLEYFCNDESSQDKTNEIGKQIKISIIADNFYNFNDDSDFELLKKNQIYTK
ncbi:metastasis-associated protein and mesoderm induction early response protein [Anaeramoeba flamelloides]|uniref:Metastasis-associated protein and mesoderm induction early response protein n=1 Tax=Anaeramoeba flamelloides TaxID=1746091 RepID=A0AAV7YM15_9EUKA|nr:metastasis-associated protein and mesoderm induction early response protein [Anaeramoeba flamelloides]